MCASGKIRPAICVGIAPSGTTCAVSVVQSCICTILNADDEGVLLTSMYEPVIGAAQKSSVDDDADYARTIGIVVASPQEFGNRSTEFGLPIIDIPPLPQHINDVLIEDDDAATLTSTTKKATSSVLTSQTDAVGAAIRTDAL